MTGSQTKVDFSKLDEIIAECEKLRELKSTEGMYSYGRLELQDVNGISQAINSGANSAYSAGALVDKYLSQVAGLNSEISDKLSEGIKTDGLK